MEWAYTLSGLVVGFIVGLTGVGGGSLMTPLLVLGFGISPVTAVGTDLLYASITKLGGGWVHARRGTVNWRIAGLLGLGSVPAAVATIFALKAFSLDSRTLSGLITTMLGVALILTALVVLLKERIEKIAKRRSVVSQDVTPRGSTAAATVATGVVLGILVTISSVGAGALGAAALLFLYPGLAAIRVVGTDIVHAVPLTAIAGLGHASLGTVDFALLGNLLLGSLPGIYLGSHLATRMPENALRPILAGMLAIIGGKLVW